MLKILALGAITGSSFYLAFSQKLRDRYRVIGAILWVLVVVAVHSTAFGKWKGDPTGYKEELKRKYPTWSSPFSKNW